MTLTLEDCQHVASTHGGKCLSTVYKTNKIKMKWECSKGHQWDACFRDVKNKNSWCSLCSGKHKLTLKECQDVAESYGGKCISTVYKDAISIINWECSQGHQWSSDFNHIKNRNQWCSICSGHQKITLKDCQEIAESHGGQCLSDTYEYSDIPMKWECSKGHRWNANFASIKNAKTWCSICAGNKKLTLQDCQEIAESYGGQCLSTVYKGNKANMKWECSQGHQWLNSFGHVKNRNQWCSQCTRYKSEESCRTIIESIMGVKFPSVRPDFLRHSSGFCLELDGYNEDKCVAMEYQGIQHYHYTPFYHNNDITNFEKQKQRDIYKYNKCKEQRIHLVVIPYHFTYENETLLKQYIVDNLNAHGII